MERHNLMFWRISEVQARKIGTQESVIIGNAVIAKTRSEEKSIPVWKK